MKIFISIPWFSPAYLAGGPIQSIANLVRDYDDGINYSIFSGDKDLGEIDLDNIVSDKWIQYNHSTKVFYSNKDFRNRKILKEIKEIRPDVLFLIGIYSFSFAIIPILFACCPNIILSARGMLHPQALSKKKIKKKLFLTFLKPLLRFRSISFHATDEIEKLHIQALMGSKVKIHVAPNFPHFYAPSVVTKFNGRLKLITVALIGPMKNYYEVLLALSECKAEIQYDIIGPIYVTEYWEKCLKVIRMLPSNITVNYLGPIKPIDLENHLKQAQIFICPSQSENYGHAIFEALSAGKPVITSHNTPWNDLSKNYAGFNIVPDVTSIKNAIDFFCDMEDFSYLKWSSGASSFASKSFSLEFIRNSYKEMFFNNSI